MRQKKESGAIGFDRCHFLTKILGASVLVLTVVVRVSAEIQPSHLFGDNAVLQRDCDLPVWGTAPAGDSITVEFAGQTVAVQSENGKWMTRLKPVQAGGPYNMIFADRSTKLVLTNILVGDVWLASGQSNMRRPLGPCSWAPPVDNWQEEVAMAKYPRLRQFYVPEAIAYSPRTEANGYWTVCSPQAVRDFSAVAYFFGRDLQRVIKVPVGILDATYGGTVAAAWTSEGTLEKMAGVAESLSLVRKFAVNGIDTNQYLSSLDGWYHRNDPGCKARLSWSSPALDTADWKEMDLPGFWKNGGLPDYRGVVWFRKVVSLPAVWAGKPAILNLGPIDDLDTTWVNGVRVGAMQHKGGIRRYLIPASVLKSGENVIAVRVLATGPSGGIYGKPQQMQLSASSDDQKPPISLAGTWKYRASNPLSKSQPVPMNPIGNPNLDSVLYNGMIAPLERFPIKGVIWYQGENDSYRARQYRTLFPALIADWRAHWQEGDFPFLFVQIAPFRFNTPELREAQLLTLNKSPNTAMVVITDAGDADVIHPPNKQVVGERLALAARALAYGEPVEYSGPLFHSLKIKGPEAILSFTHVGSGLKSGGGPLKGFTIAGKNMKFVSAQAEIRGDTVVMTSDQVTHPVAVRYGWSNVPDVNLYNREGLPASPFRTDGPN